MSQLRPKQARFVAEYLIDLNATQAAIRAGYSPASARTQAADLLTNPNIADAVAKAEALRARRTGISQDRVLRELALMGFANMLDYITPQADGSHVVDFSALERDTAAAIQEVTVEEYAEGRGEAARQVKRTKFKLSDKRANLELIGRHLGMWKDRQEISGPDGGPIETKDVSARDLLVEKLARLADRQGEDEAGVGDGSPLPH